MDEQSYNLCGDFVKKYLDPSKPTTIADVGAMNVNGVYRPLFDNPLWSYVGFDLAPGPNVDRILSHEHHWGVEEDFDVVISGQCLEHVRMPWFWFQSVVGMLEIGGLVFISAPNTWEFHPYPIDCWRIFPDGMKALFLYGNITPLSIYMDGPFTIGIGIKDLCNQS